MSNPRSCFTHNNKSLYTLFWLLLSLVVSLSISVLVLLTVILNPLMIRLNDSKTLVIVVDPDAAQALSPLLMDPVNAEDIP